MNLCVDCKYAAYDVDSCLRVCIKKGMPSWFNVVISDNRVACVLFEDRKTRSEAT